MLAQKRFLLNQKLKFKIGKLFILSFSLSLWGCISYYQRNVQFNQAFEQSQFKKAKSLIEDQNERKNSVYRNRFLQYVHLGTVLHRLGLNQESNLAFEKAHIYLEDFSTDYTGKALGYLSTPSAEAYIPSGFETYMVNYYKILNYLNLDQIESALVEVRRLDVKVQRLKTQYHNAQKFNQSAFLHIIMGLVYDAANDDNNAFIAYRNAYTIYSESYANWFGMQVPKQLILDMIRVGKSSGFEIEVQNLIRKHALKHEEILLAGNTEVHILQKGLIPVKSDAGITFATWQENDRFVVEQLELGLRFVFPAPEDKEVGRTFPKFTRIALPKLGEARGNIAKPNPEYQLIENLEKVAQKSLEDQYEKLIGEALIRLFVKKSMELALKSKKQEGLSILMNLANTFTETSDTRSWTTLPQSIYYKREILSSESTNGKAQTKFVLCYD